MAKLDISLIEVGKIVDSKAGLLRDVLNAHGVSVSVATSSASLPPLCISLFSEDSESLPEQLRRMQSKGVERNLVVATGPRRPGSAEIWRMLNAGAIDVLIWDAFDDPAAHILARVERWLTIERALHSERVRALVVGASRAWHAALRGIIEFAMFSAQSISLFGESGVGKELVARLIHELDPLRCDRPLVVLDCTTIVPDLAGSELFGHERGAFTGADQTRTGAFEEANGGTLFLDEIGELPPRLQTELLRVIQEKTFKRVGSNTWRQTDFRLVCATNRDLDQEVAQGRFRRDLYYRIVGAEFRLPPLRDRRDDILPLVKHFLSELLDGPPDVDPAVVEYLVSRHYEGNIRELKQYMQRVAAKYVSPGPITLGTLVDAFPEGRVSRDADGPGLWELVVRQALESGLKLSDIRRNAVNTAYNVALADANGDRTASAARLDVSTRAVQKYVAESTGRASD